MTLQFEFCHLSSQSISRWSPRKSEFMVFPFPYATSQWFFKNFRCCFLFVYQMKPVHARPLLLFHLYVVIFFIVSELMSIMLETFWMKWNWKLSTTCGHFVTLLATSYNTSTWFSRWNFVEKFNPILIYEKPEIICC